MIAMPLIVIQSSRSSTLWDAKTINHLLYFSEHIVERFFFLGKQGENMVFKFSVDKASFMAASIHDSLLHAVL